MGIILVVVVDLQAVTMKFFAFAIVAALVIVAQAAMTDEEKAKVKELAEGCISKTGVDKELIGKARAHEYTGRDEKLAAYFSCMMGEMKFQKDDGSFDTSRMIEKLPDHEAAVKAVKKCDQFDAALTKDVNAMNFMYCFYKAVGKDFRFY